MTLNMADGPPANLPLGMDAYAGYVNDSGIGETWPEIALLAKKRGARAFSITTDGSVAECADVERGAMIDWRGYFWGYCEVSSVNTLVAQYGRPPKLWTAHRDPRLGRHICGPKTCNYGGNLVTAADGTQWTNHGGAWDESILLDNFFDRSPPAPSPQGAKLMLAATPTGNGLWRLDPNGAVTTYGDAQYLGGPNTSQVAGKWGGPPVLPAGQTCVAIVAHPSSQGYWIESSVGNLYAYGAAKYMTPN